MSHIIGYVRAINSEEYEALKDQGYDRNSLIGKNGIERAAESLLRGVKGTRTVYQDIDTGIVRELSSTEPIPGHDIYLTIDVNLKGCLRCACKNNRRHNCKEGQQEELR